MYVEVRRRCGGCRASLLCACGGLAVCCGRVRPDVCVCLCFCILLWDPWCINTTSPHNRKIFGTGVAQVWRLEESFPKTLMNKRRWFILRSRPLRALPSWMDNPSLRLIYKSYYRHSSSSLAVLCVDVPRAASSVFLPVKCKVSPSVLQPAGHAVIRAQWNVMVTKLTVCVSLSRLIWSPTADAALMRLQRSCQADLAAQHRAEERNQQRRLCFQETERSELNRPELQTLYLLLEMIRNVFTGITRKNNSDLMPYVCVWRRM